ncbi:MAG: zinc transporter ZntB [Rhodospirillales bacterium]|nr:zinc transporter ZntB [Rhodospirillales bacterium]MBO6787997.1 zinc transporter ZntB [Rhodospirillales bacterium]
MTEQDGLIGAYELDGKGGGRPLAWDDLSRVNAFEHPVWIHLDRKGVRSESWLRNESGLGQLQVDALLAGETRPRVAFMHEGVLMTLRGVNLNPGADPEDMVSLRIWVENGRIITVRLRRLMAVNDVRERLAEGDGPVSTSDTLRMLAAALIQRMGPVIEEMNDETDALEDDLVVNPAADIRHRLKTLRRAAIALRRYLAPQRDALARVHAETIPWMPQDHRLAFRESAEQVARIVEDMDAIRERASVIQDELTNRAAEHMNRNMYTLSVVAALMLPLGVITGMLGMNVGGVPLAEHKEGFLMISGLLIFVVALQVLIFRKLKWI